MISVSNELKGKYFEVSKITGPDVGQGPCVESIYLQPTIAFAP